MILLSGLCKRYLCWWSTHLHRYGFISIPWLLRPISASSLGGRGFRWCNCVAGFPSAHPVMALVSAVQNVWLYMVNILFLKGSFIFIKCLSFAGGRLSHQNVVFLPWRNTRKRVKKRRSESFSGCVNTVGVQKPMYGKSQAGSMTQEGSLLLDKGCWYRLVVTSR